MKTALQIAAVALALITLPVWIFPAAFILLVHQVHDIVFKEILSVPETSDKGEP
jgi:hypothetical protein